MLANFTEKKWQSEHKVCHCIMAEKITNSNFYYFFQTFIKTFEYKLLEQILHFLQLIF